MSGSICSDRTSRFAYLQSDLIVTHIPVSYIFVHIYRSLYQVIHSM